MENPKAVPFRTLKDAQSLSLGILGGGQLAQMLVEASKPLGLKVAVLAPNLDQPVAHVTSNITLGSTDNLVDFLSFQEDKDLITIESEFINPDLLQKSTSTVSPSPSLLKSLRDRLPQKESLIAHQIPTSPLHHFEDLSQAQQWMSENQKGLVFKQRLFGYDGYGTRIVRNSDDLKNFESESVNLKDWIAEELISFNKELAISFARNQGGQIMQFPLVESLQQDSKCLWVKGPLDTTPFQNMISSLKSYINTIDFVGLITFELFQTAQGPVVNEVAPRVHNSAHYSIEALNISQFTAHLMAICNLELPESPKVLKSFAMYNLIGERDIPASELTMGSNSDDIHLHWYHKSQSRKGRKMGHITSLADTSAEALLKLENARKEFKL